MSEWVNGILGDVLHEVNDRNTNGCVDLVLSVTEGRGIVPQTEVFKKRIATADTTKYKIVEFQDIAWNPYLLWTGAIGQWLGSDPGVTSPVYPIFRARDGQDARFWGLVLESGLLTPYFDSTAIGSIQRRRRTTVPVFNTASVLIPSAAEQRRIVDVMAAVDAQTEALEEEAAATRHLLRCMLAVHFELVTGDKRSVVDLCSHVIGGIWGSPEGENEVDVLALGPRIYASATTGFVTDGSPLRSFSLKQVEQRLVQPNDIILERSGGSPEQPVGRVVIAEEGLAPCIPTDFQRLMRPDVEKVDPRYLFWRLQYDWNSGLTRAYSRRTTGITNLSVKDYIARLVSVPSRGEQRDLVAKADTINASLTAIKTELTQLRDFRSSLLASLLNQEAEIPDTYDTFLEGTS